jgi:hypothetical protein
MRRWAGRRHPRTRAALALAAIFVAPSAGAQVAPPPENPRFKMGPLYMEPGLSIRDVGTDTNVFNEPTNPKRDFTATVGPLLELGLRLTGVRLSLNTVTDYVYYHRYKDERAVNRRNALQLEVGGTRMSAYAGVEDAETSSRQGPEIDRRARRSEPTYMAGFQTRLGVRTNLQTTVRRSEQLYGAGQDFRGVSLAEALNSSTESVTATVKFDLTPITTFVLAADAQRKRYDTSRFRDADTTRVAAGFSFLPEGILSGAAQVGVRDYDARGTGVPSYRGIVSQGDITYAMREGTRLSFRVQRDISSSYEPRHPYYLSTGGGVFLSQRLFGPMDVVAGISHDELAYRNFVADEGDRRRDTIDLGQVGIGFRVRQTGRFGVNLELVRRQSPLPDREYEALRVFGTFSYGLTR